VLVRARLVDVDDVGMRELRDRLRLAQQSRLGSRRGLTRGAIAAEDLERELAIELRVVGGVHDTDTAGTELLEDRVAADPYRCRGGLVERVWPRPGAQSLGLGFDQGPHGEGHPG